MLKNYFSVVLRNLRKNKTFSLINIAGLSIGIACCLIIGIYVLHETSYDRFFPDADNVYRLAEQQLQSGDYYHVASTPPALGPHLLRNYPEVEATTAFSRVFNQQLVQYDDKSFEEFGGFHIDSAFFDFFPFALSAGSIKGFFTSTDRILISENMATRFFGNEDPVGKTIRMDRSQDLVVAGVVANPPVNSHIKYNYFLPMANLATYRNFNDWGANWMYTYIRLKDGTDPAILQSKIENILIDQLGQKGKDFQEKLYLQPLTRIHLFSNFDFRTDFADTASAQQVYLFAVIGLVILLISCFNFINLTTAHSFQRGREVGVRKVTGATRSQLVRQFSFETLFLALVAAMVALLLAGLTLPYFADLSGLPLKLNLVGTGMLALLLATILIMTSLLAGIYPALFLSSFNAIRALKGVSSPSGQRRFTVRKTLVVIQFALSVILIIGAIIIHNQIQYVLHRNLGFDSDQIVYMPIKGDLSSDDHYENFRNELMKQSQVVQVTRSNGLPVQHEGSFGGVEWEGMPENHQDFLMNYIEVDPSFVQTYGLHIIEGKDLTPRVPGDTTAYYLINETALHQMQLKNPVGKRIEEGYIVGVVRDFSFKSAFTKVEPMILRYAPDNMKMFVSIRLAAGNVATAVKSVERVYKEFNPGYPSDLQFLDDSIGALYDRQVRFGKLATLFAGLAVFISCLSLFGLSTFAAEQRTKEVGIRKVLGASGIQIARLLSASFLGLVVVSVVIAIPAAYFIMRYWLNAFAYRISLDSKYFLLAGATALIIALVTVSAQTLRAAWANPVRSIRNE